LAVRKALVGQEVSTETKDTVGIRYQAMYGEDTANWEDLACAVVRSTVRKLMSVIITCSYDL
jgi:hypothetical protein